MLKLREPPSEAKSFNGVPAILPTHAASHHNPPHLTVASTLLHLASCTSWQAPEVEPAMSEAAEVVSSKRILVAGPAAGAPLCRELMRTMADVALRAG